MVRRMIETMPLRDAMIEIVRSYVDKNPWVAYRDARLTRRGAAMYVLQHGIFTRHSRRCWAYVVANCPEVEVRRFIVRENLYEEEGIEAKSHYLKLVKLGLALGLTVDEIENAVPAPGTRAAMLIWETLTKDRHWLIGAAAKAALEMMSLPECGSLPGTQAMLYRTKLGLSLDDVEFHVIHDEVDKVHGGGAIDLIAKYLPAYPQVSVDDVLGGLDDSMFAFNLFHGAIAELSEAADRSASASAN
jgi:pyrroloquinoline quinone (PQQ) biosynthesis protein C